MFVDPLAEQTMTPYQYVSNNPIMRIDPTGMNDHDYKKNKETGRLEMVKPTGDDFDRIIGSDNSELIVDKGVINDKNRINGTAIRQKTDLNGNLIKDASGKNISESINVEADIYKFNSEQKAQMYGFDSLEDFINNIGKTAINPADENGDGSRQDGNGGGGLWNTIKSWFTGKPKYTNVTVLVGPLEEDFQEGIPCVECHHTTMIPNGKKMGDLAGGTGSIHFLGISSFNLEGEGKIDGKPKYIKVTDWNSFGGANLAAKMFLFRVADGIQMVNSITGTGVSLSEDTNVRMMLYNTGANDSIEINLKEEQSIRFNEQSPKGDRFRDSLRNRFYYNTSKTNRGN